LSIFLLLVLFTFCWTYRENHISYNIHSPIPIVIISWNNYHFLRQFIHQIKQYPNPIIILDNHSNYPPLLKYYDEIQTELKSAIEIRRLDKNYGHTVYKTLQHTLPDVYLLSDPDLELNKNMPFHFDSILLHLSKKYKSYKVGLALDIQDKDDFLPCKDYTIEGLGIHEYESRFWKHKIDNEDYEVYYADVDTTFCLVNNQFKTNPLNNLRIAGDFTAKHLPWYKDYITKNISKEELDHWKQNNISSSILQCLSL